MKWTFRWYGKDDVIPIEHVAQIPCSRSCRDTLNERRVTLGNWRNWALKAEAAKANMELYGIESVSIHDAIKAGTEERDHYIENYKTTIRNLGACGVKVICYSFKPVFGWLKTDLNYEFEDGSIGLVFDQSVVDQMEPSEMFSHVQKQTGRHQVIGLGRRALGEIQSSDGHVWRH